MRRFLFPLAVLGCIALAGVLAWMWATDYSLIHQCSAAGGAWNPDQRVCEISSGQIQRVIVSPRE